MYDVENELKKMGIGSWRKAAENSEASNLILKEARPARTVHPLGTRRERQDAPTSPYSKHAGVFLIGYKGGRIVKLTSHLNSLCSKQCSYTSMDRDKSASVIRRNCEIYSLTLKIVRRHKLAISNGFKPRSTFHNSFGYIIST